MKPNKSKIDLELIDISVEYRVPTEKISSIKEHIISQLKGKGGQNIFKALDHVDLKIRSGEVFGIMGRNGAGKSTLLKVISRVIIPTEGRVVIYGKVYPLLQVGAGFHPELTGKENIFLNGTLLGHSRVEINRKIDEIVEFAEIGNFINAPVRTYSSGMQARLGFAVASAWQPDILVLDEVLAVGDISFQEKCYKRIRQFQENNTTTILVSHSPERISEMCERAVWLHRGKIMKMGEAKKIAEAYRDFKNGK